MIPLADAQARVRAACAAGGVLPAVRCSLVDALGLVLAEPVVASGPVPPFANTAMDGYALRAADTEGAPVRLRVVGELPAGRNPAGLYVGAGEAVRIMTGAPMPPGADAVVMVELTSTNDARDEVEVHATVPAGNHVRPAGEDLVAGQEVFGAGTLLGPGHLGVLASAGCAEVSVVRRARVGVLSTGDELVEDAASSLRPGQIRDANRYALLGLLREAGCDAVDLGIARDDEADVRRAIERGLSSCDALLTSGGVSMGDYDPVKVVLGELGGDQAWMQVAIRPAKPLSFAVVDGRAVFGLPGNPASSMVSFELFARPALLAMMGRSDVDRPVVPAIADDGLARTPDGKLHFVRVVLRRGDDHAFHAISAGGQASNLIVSMAVADGLAMVPDGGGVEPGGWVDVIVLR